MAAPEAAAGHNAGVVDAQALMQRLADAIVARGLATPAVLLLEALKPWGFACGQALLLLNPLVGAPRIAGQEVVDLLEDRRNVEMLLAAIEQRRSGQAL